MLHILIREWFYCFIFFWRAKLTTHSTREPRWDFRSSCLLCYVLLYDTTSCTLGILCGFLSTRTCLDLVWFGFVCWYLVVTSACSDTFLLNDWKPSLWCLWCHVWVFHPWSSSTLTWPGPHIVAFNNRLWYEPLVLSWRWEPVFIKANETTSLRVYFCWLSSWDLWVSSVDDGACQWWVGIWSSLYVAVKRYFNNDTERKKLIGFLLSARHFCRTVVLQRLTRLCRPLYHCWLNAVILSTPWLTCV